MCMCYSYCPCVWHHTNEVIGLSQQMYFYSLSDKGMLYPKIIRVTCVIGLWCYSHPKQVCFQYMKESTCAFLSLFGSLTQHVFNTLGKVFIEAKRPSHCSQQATAHFSCFLSTYLLLHRGREVGSSTDHNIQILLGMYSMRSFFNVHCNGST